MADELVQRPAEAQECEALREECIDMLEDLEVALKQNLTVAALREVAVNLEGLIDDLNMPGASRFDSASIPPSLEHT